jgi:ankyrin repeat protein
VPEPTGARGHRSDTRSAFVEAAVLHGPLDAAAAILAAEPGIATADVHTAAILGDEGAVRRFLAEDPSHAVSTSGPLGWDALTHLCFSRYLRLDPARSEGFVRAAILLLDAGADPNTGFLAEAHRPEPVRESALYGAAGMAHHAALTRLLLERGADPNDEEVTYHTPETHDNGALVALVESGRLTADSLATLLLRKADWHDPAGIRYLLERGADPNRHTRWGFTGFQQALRRDNEIAGIEALLDHGADPALGNRADGRSGGAMAARRGRGDVLDALERRGIPAVLEGTDHLLAAVARNDGAAARRIASGTPAAAERLKAEAGEVLACFAGNGNTPGVGLLLDFGIDVAIRFAAGDGYWGIAPESTALHVAAWRARHDTVRFLVARGAPVAARDGQGRTPLQLAVRAAVDSYWTRRRSPESVRALLDAGASPEGVPFPSGYAEMDALLASHRQPPGGP